MANKNDIELGDGKIVDWIEIDFQIQKPFSVDKIVKPIMPFFGYLETVCVHECCGVDAFDFSEKSIREAAMNFDVDGQLFYFLEVYEKLEALNAEVFEVTRMNYSFAKNVFLELLTHIIENLKKINDEQTINFKKTPHRASGKRYLGTDRNRNSNPW